MSPVKANAEALKVAETEVTELNKAITGVGLRHRAGQTRGKSPSVIKWQAFDTDKPDTLPKTMAEFTSIVGVKDEKTVVDYAIDGYNSAAYGLASDELYDFVEDSWSPEVQAQFRLSVRNFAKMTNKSLEEAVGIIKPSLVAALAEATAK